MDAPREHILKVFSVIQLHILKWNEVIVNSRPLLKEISLRIEQLECMKKVKQCPLTTLFPDLKHRIEQNIQTAIDENILVLHAAWEDLSLANQKLKSSCDLTLKAYSEKRDEWESNPHFFFGTPLYPPLSSALEWIEDINVYYSNQLLVVKHDLEMFDYNTKSIASFSKIFNCKHPESWIDTILCKMSFYLEADK